MKTGLVLIVSIGLGLSRPAWAAEQAEPVATTERATADDLLTAADAAVDAGDLILARKHYAHVVADYPGSPEAKQARRALRILDVHPATTRETKDQPDTGSNDVVVRNEAYSLHTSERLRLSVWEKLDFGTTAFFYGLSVGYSYALSLKHPSASEGLTPMALGALAYGLGAVGYLSVADPDRGDLPLALAITSYIPTTTLLLAGATSDNPDSHNVASATAIAGLASVPVALIATHQFNLDPGDTQLVRDAGFWGLALSTMGTLGFGGTTRTYGSGDYAYSLYEGPSARKTAVAGLIGLYGGMGLGLLSAHVSNVSLERVRISTWGGYGGAVVGMLLGASVDADTPKDTFRGGTIGALAGLVITFLSTSKLDGIPAEDRASRPSWASRLVPSLMQVPTADGRSAPSFGVAGAL
jgi:hypothetical protein